MIRHSDGQTAFSDLYNYYYQRRDQISRWIQASGRAYAGVAMSDAAIGVIEARLGRGISHESRAATAWIVNMCIDIERKFQEHEAVNRGVLTQTALNNAHAVLQTTAVAHFTRLPPHAAAQLSVMADHIADNHL